MTANDIPAFDYEAAKDFYFDKLQADRTGKGRMESALFHTAQFIFDKGCQRQAALLARIVELERRHVNMHLQCRVLEETYDAQCASTDEWVEKYRAEVERKADATLLQRVAELEKALAVVNARLAVANEWTPA